MDAQVGKILNTLKEEGLEDNTIVIFTSDHGFHLGEHDFWMKVSLKEESVRVPLIVKIPGQRAQVSNSFVELIDLYPTIAELAGVEVKDNIQGISFVPTLDDPDFKTRDMAFSVNRWGGKHAFLLRNDKWAFTLYNEDGSDGVELFDMEHDPKQFNNLANFPAYQDIVAQLKEEVSKKLVAIRNNDLPAKPAK
jgi:arylsulfatase A-like enzyme